MELCNEIGALYIDTVDRAVGRASTSTPSSGRRRAPTTRCARAMLAAKRARKPGGTTAVSCCGANPGMVSWFVKQALLNVAARSRRQVRRAEDPRGVGPARQEGRRQGHPHRRARHPARQEPQAAWTSSSTPGRSRASCRRACSRPSSAGARTRRGCRTMAASTRPAAARRSICCSPAPTRACARGRRRARAVRLPGHPQRVDLDRRLLHAARRRQGRLPADLPLRLSPVQRRGAVAARAVRPRRRGARTSIIILDEHEIVDGIDELGVLLYGHGKNAYWYGSQLSIDETRADRALSERDRPAGDLGGARRHGVGAGESEGRHRRGRRDGLPPLPRGADALSRPGHRPLHRLDAARPTGRACSPRTSTATIPGSSATCWCGDRGGRPKHRYGRHAAARIGTQTTSVSLFSFLMRTAARRRAGR